MTSHPVVRLLYTVLLSLVGGLLFNLLHVPLPWLLGPMTFTLIGSRAVKAVRPSWPSWIRDTALILIGYSIGLTFTMTTLRQIGHQLPTMALMTFILILLCCLLAWIITRLSGLPFPTVLMGSIPGGLTQMVVLAEDTKGIDLTVVAFLQVVRLLMIIFCVPVLVFSPMFGGDSSNGAAADTVSAVVEHAATVASTGWGVVALYAAVSVAAALLANRIHFPSAYMLGPMIITAIIHLLGVEGPALPAWLLSAAQVMIGTYVGLLLKPEKLQNKGRVALLAVTSSTLLIASTIGFSYLLTKLHAVSSTTAFLSLAPGGMDQMGIIAHEVNADISIVTGYQIFRTWFIYFAIPPLLRMLFRVMKRRKVQQQGV
ncbi:monooxygenase [Paenibacillus sp. CCS19]|uniref:AbrB family transcriptional regulator n=1 Tax=Paenibacillus sp. CCS19 TaxID=3158387 RepID=UPI002569B2B6|nr:AbrB family transcriptional regulator [Paenibacillus cellulosilyticus]GMK40326.1 monooxygenase [Paenibacillus cellulosilyticus]